MDNTSKISLYIPAFNAAHLLPSVIAALKEQSLAPTEILVIDDGSIDETAAIAEEHGVKVFRQPKNMGLAQARNRALEEARYDLIACIDSDVEVEPDWLQELFEYLQTHTEVTAVGGRLDEKYTSCLPDKWRKEHMAQHWGNNIRTDIPFIFGANGLYRKKALQEIGGFNPAFKTNGEDSNICRRLGEAGHKIAYIPTARCWHLKRDTMGSLLKAYWKWMRHPICIEWPIGNWRSLLRFSQRRASHNLTTNLLPDLKNLKLDLVLIDLLLFPYAFYMEFMEFLRTRQKTNNTTMPTSEAESDR